MKVLVTGSEGNIGKFLLSHLRSKGHEVLEMDIKPKNREGYIVADINNPVDVLPAFDWKPDVVFGLSGMAGRAVCEQATASSITEYLS